MICSTVLKAEPAALRCACYNGASARQTETLRTGRTQMDKGIPPTLIRQLPNLRDHGGKRKGWTLICSTVLKAEPTTLRRSRHNGVSARRTETLRTGRTQMDKGIPPALARQLLLAKYGNRDYMADMRHLKTWPATPSAFNVPKTPKRTPMRPLAFSIREAMLSRAIRCRRSWCHPYPPVRRNRPGR